MNLPLDQQQRLCVARLLAVEPEVILMDEPCSALDPIATSKIEELMLDLQKELYHRHRHAQHAAGGPRVRRLRLHAAGRNGRVRADDISVYQAAKKLTEDYISGKYG